MKSLKFLFWSFAVIATSAMAETKGLSAYLDQNLRKLDEKGKNKFWKDFDSLAKRTAEEKKEQWGPDPWLAKTFQADRKLFLITEVYPGFDVPDVSYARVHFFDQNWKRVFQKSFPTGYRAFIQKASLVHSKEFQQDLLEFVITSSGPFLVNEDGEQKPAFEQGHYQRQFYAMKEKELMLVRIEDEKGDTVINSYRWSVPMKGGAVPRKTKEEWIATLTSKSPVEQLATLVWLSGSHMKSDDPRQADVNQQSVEDSKLIEAVRNDPRTKMALRKLENSPVSWIKSYARIALE